MIVPIILFSVIAILIVANLWMEFRQQTPLEPHHGGRPTRRRKRNATYLDAASSPIDYHHGHNQHGFFDVGDFGGGDHGGGGFDGGDSGGCGD